MGLAFHPSSLLPNLGRKEERRKKAKARRPNAKRRTRKILVKWK